MNDTRLELTAEQQSRRAKGYPLNNRNLPFGSKLAMAWFHSQIPDTQISYYWKDGDVPGFAAFITFFDPTSSPVGVIILSNHNKLPLARSPKAFTSGWRPVR